MKLDFELKTNLAPEKIWPLYSNIENWYKWEEDLQHISLGGPFITGSSGEMILEGQPPIKYELVEVTDNRSFCDKTAIPGIGDLYFNHELIPLDSYTIIRHSVEFISSSGEDAEEQLTFLQQVFADVPHSIFALRDAYK
ncbi:hypothetical protein [Sporolactobacillus pectinivorans]|uniref:hypothetical protein n=1 Tax=Sporolactobacillus pectinivorans TaxID=1591408 RepID=UPI000C26B22F|nr:hypothetical protein [Sporolactobacillus pectinivorans]